MVFDTVQVELAMKSGLSFVCAMCTKYWLARDFGVPAPRCIEPAGSCGSPLAGMGFPLYAGPLVSFDHVCFVCGALPKYAVTSTSRAVFGVCAKHVEMLGTVRPAEFEKLVEISVGSTCGLV